MGVLILARDFDPTADAVVRKLTGRGVQVLRTDLSAFPTSLSVDAALCDRRWRGRLWNSHHSMALEEMRSIWCRNPSTYRFRDEMPTQVQDLAYREAKLGLGGVLGALDVLWANHPNRCADAIWKPYQWRMAAECGLSVADTAITNDPEAAARFVGAHSEGETITKALGPSGVTVDGQTRVAFTRRLDRSDVANLNSVALTATTLQRFVPKAFEVRLTVIGDAWFPVAIHALSERARVDWRSDPEALTFRPVEVPDGVAQGVAMYMKRANLVYSGLDFVVTPDDEWVFLEANSGPQFGFLEAATGEPMTAAMADLLAQGATQ
ncbi:hypothetical protein GCM10023321_80500 [Pseudonocardia eucalypti]|uniref:ATP-grasp domain-containing protein n=1 Tax=Pseudonocardia eucalypti TaxID=648755 RepID=A0ABP9RD13_9PSEU|nr:ATP-grasp ribosomal peptide maturase [Pseudonocardia eucalypti]